MDHSSFLPASAVPSGSELAPATAFQWLLVLGFPPDVAAACLLRSHPPEALQTPLATPVSAR